MNIDIILPYKEIFSENKASAVSLTVKNSMEYSEFKSNIKIYGQNTSNSFLPNNFRGVKVNRLLHFSKNKSILYNYLNSNQSVDDYKKIIEIHNRPYVFNLASKKISNHPITLHYHNDPRTMKGSKTIKEREYIIQKAAAVYFVSSFIRDCFLEGIKSPPKNLHVLPNGIQRRLNEQPNKKKEILFIGRLVPEKGSHLFVKAIRNIVKNYLDWNFTIIGTAKAGQNKLITNYEKKVIDEFKALGKNTSYLGFVKNIEVQEILKSASILVVPSLWDDPFPLTALEGLSNGVAIIASKRGGLIEMLSEKGLLLEDIDEDSLQKSILSFINNHKLLVNYQNKSWNDYIYNQNDVSKLQDKIRRQIFNSYY